MTASALFGLAVLTGCSSTSSSATSTAGTAANKKMVVGVSLAGYSTDFWAAYVKYEAADAKQLGLTLVGPVSANGDAATQASQIQTMINQHVNALLVNPVDSAAISTSDALAAKAHIPVVTMDVGPTSGPIYAVVRADNVLIGKEACQYVGKQANGTGTAAVLEGDLASINGLDRANGFIDCMKREFPKMRVLKYATKWDSTTAVDDAQTAIRAYSDLKGIYSSFSGPDQGILAAIHSAGAQNRTVLRDGRHIVTDSVAALDQAAVVDAMVGSAVVPVAQPDTGASTDAPVRLQIRELSVRSPGGSVEKVSLSLHAGECLGLVGLRGSGNATVADVVAGLVKADDGGVLVDDAAPRASDGDSSRTRGIGYVPEDRHARGFVSLMGVDENLTLPILTSISRLGVISSRQRESVARDLRTRLSIVSSTGRQLVGELSGGNQQKVVAGRALASKPSVLVIVSPTTGVDVASKAVLLGVIDNARRDGMAVLLVSDDIEELRIATRLMVMVRGRVVREFRERPWNERDAIAAAEGLVA